MKKVRHASKYPLQSLSVSSDQRFLVVGGRDILRLIKIEKGEEPINEQNEEETTKRSPKERLFSRDNNDLENALAGLTTTYPGMDDDDHLTKQHYISDDNSFTKKIQMKKELYHFEIERDLKTGSMNLNHNGNHVAFHPQNNTVLATGSTKGAVVCWNLERKGKKAARVISAEHTRTVTRVDWHPTTPWVLASGSIDGTVKIWDTRRDGKKFKASKNIKPKSSAVRDAMYNPHDGNIIACAFDNGQVQLWDVRKTKSCVKKFAAHHGYVLTLDWHPSEPRVLATGGRDGQIKIWNTGSFGLTTDGSSILGSSTIEKFSDAIGGFNKTSNKCTQIQVIQTIASVACVKWRSSSHPQQLASSSTVVDPTINVWDVLHPYVPIACFDGHRSAVTDVTWVKSTDGKSNIFSCSTDHDVLIHPLASGKRPIESASPTAIAVAPRGGFATFSNPVPTSRRYVIIILLFCIIFNCYYINTFI